jgi:hypothetical protein
VALAAQRGSGFSIPRMRTKIMATRIRASASKVIVNNIPCEVCVVYTIFLNLSIGKLNKKSQIILYKTTNTKY